ncbi:helix-turn-helix transcriptional regulator [Brevundimonas sp.]|uniref:helix-turn-helix domain-containing protein n=1 Tax=Brevundimonas sp. TaxID=1871086 RepID=UPI001D36848C|nr:helix-turn-helix transcriptional regulator [Brevundimonas sp.]MBA3999517.1 XRE family transcriptional regulator [Brevundimonas sp.]
MTRFRDDPDANALGQALAGLRKARGLSQAEAGARMGVTSQAWGLYEAGRRPGMFRPDVQRRLTAALDLTPEDLALEMARRPAVPAPASDRLEESGRAFSTKGPPGSVRRTLQLRDDDLAPWAGSGVVLVYDLSVWPRRDQGCVVETADGPVIGLYHRGDRDTVVLRGPGGDKRVLQRSWIGSVGAVVARLEGVDWPQ